MRNPVILCELREFLRRAPEHQQIALAQAHLRKLVADPAIASPEAHYDDAERSEEIDAPDGASDEARMRSDDHLHQVRLFLGVARLLGRHFRVFRDGMQSARPGSLSMEAISSGDARTTKMSPACSFASPPGSRCGRPSRSHSTKESRSRKVSCSAVRRLVDPARFGLDDELGAVAIELQIVGFGGRARATGHQPPAERHVDDAEHHQRGADRRDVEEVEARASLGFEQVVRKQECGCAEERQRRAKRSRE